jgi:hypothetical protein
MKKIGAFILIFLLISCKSKQLIGSGNASEKNSTQKIIEGHYSNNFDFSTLYIKANAKYKDAKLSQSVTAEIKIKKDEKILVSVRFLGITMAKALITPTSVQYYEKLNSTYFEGDYIALSKWLGTDLDYNKVQNLLLGKPIDDLKTNKYVASIVDKLYKLEATSNEATRKEFFFESERYLLKKQEVTQPSKSRKLLIHYPVYQQKESLSLPLNLTIEANEEAKKTSINMDYKAVTINEEFAFPYAVPEGFERIYIK